MQQGPEPHLVAAWQQQQQQQQQQRQVQQQQLSEQPLPAGK
jgi:hypothetical protein